MNNIIILEKNIILENIKDLINISVDEDISYLKRNDGVFCHGQVFIRGLYVNEEEIEKSFNEKVELNNLVLYQNIHSLEEFSLSIEDFDYALSDDNLQMHIKLKINSFQEIESSFLAQEPILEIKEEKPKEEEIPFLTQILNSKKYEKSLTFFVYKKNQSLEQIAEKYHISKDELKQYIKEDVKEGDLISIPFNHE